MPLTGAASLWGKASAAQRLQLCFSSVIHRMDAAAVSPCRGLRAGSSQPLAGAGTWSCCYVYCSLRVSPHSFPWKILIETAAFPRSSSLNPVIHTEAIRG